MKINSILVSTACLLACACLPNEAKAWKPQAPYCYINCGIPVGSISANPASVIVPTSSSVGSTVLTWSWDFIHGPATFPLACIYVRENASTVANVVQCEWPGNTHHTTIPWIEPNSMYTFTLGPYQGDTVAVHSLLTLVPAQGSQVSVDVIATWENGGGGGGGGPIIEN